MTLLDSEVVTEQVGEATFAIRQSVLLKAKFFSEKVSLGRMERRYYSEASVVNAIPDFTTTSSQCNVLTSISMNATLERRFWHGKYKK